MINKALVDYVKNGFAIVPIHFGSKAPARERWNEQENTVTDPNQAATLTGNVGLAHAYSTPAPSVAVDVDDEVLATLRLKGHGICLNQLLNADDAVQIVSGKEGREKLLYRLPTGTPPMESIQINGGNPEHVILEFRCAAASGLTMQDVLPPSIHPETWKPYRWGGKGDWRNLPEIPATLMRIWQEEILTRHSLKRRRHQSPLAAVFKAVDDTPRQRARLAEMTRHISADCPYELYRDMVWAHLSLGWHDAEELAKKWCLTAPDRFDAVSFTHVVASFDVSRTPTIGTIIHHARQGGWHE